MDQLRSSAVIWINRYALMNLYDDAPSSKDREACLEQSTIVSSADMCSSLGLGREQEKQAKPDAARQCRHPMYHSFVMDGGIASVTGELAP